MTVGPDSFASAPVPFQTERTVFAVTGAAATFVALLVDGALVALAGAEGSQTRDPDHVAKSLYFVACLVAVGLAIGVAVLTRRRPRLASLLGTAAVLLGLVATVAIAQVASGFSGPEPKLIVLVIWLFLTSPLDVAVVLGLLPSSMEPGPLWGPAISLAYVVLSTALPATVMFKLENGVGAWGSLIVWLLLTSPITVLGVRGAVALGRLK